MRTVTDPPAEPYLKEGKAREVQQKMADAYVLLHQVRLTLAAAHQPEHVLLKQALHLVLTAKVQVGLRAHRGQENQRTLDYLERSKSDAIERALAVETFVQRSKDQQHE